MTLNRKFKEDKFVFLCTIIILIIWVTFIGLFIHFAVELEQAIQNSITGLVSVLNAYTILVCLFGHKLFIIFRPKLRAKQQTDSQVYYSARSTPIQSRDFIVAGDIPMCTSKGRQLMHKF